MRNYCTFAKNVCTQQSATVASAIQRCLKNYLNLQFSILKYFPSNLLPGYITQLACSHLKMKLERDKRT